jgi:hypothetical protein
MGINAHINAGSPPFWLHSMIVITMLVSCCSWPPAELALQWQWRDPSWTEPGPVYSSTIRSRRVHSTSACSFCWTMTRPRGRPRRGSPWKPRRPSISRSDSTSLKLLPRSQSGQISVASRNW